ncbi:MAG: signal peptide peptidase SppA [Bacteroidales bacterium]|jgi:protease-4|nr:signal peptide peptidase SppA [Bacteroidales bacterium]
MKGFFKYLLASTLGVLVAGIILFMLVFGAIGAMVASQDKPVKVKSNTVLHIELNQPIADRSSNNPMKNFNFSAFKPMNELGLDAILKNIEKAKEDENITGIYLDLTSIPTGMASLEEIRNALLDFKESDKFILSYADYYSHKTYYLATVSDSIFLNPEGAINFVGLNSQIMFYKKALEKLGVEPQIIRHGKFKSAVEPFMLNKMSEANRNQIETYMGSIWDNMVKGISQERGIDIKQLNNYADALTIKNAKAALEAKFIDGLKYKDEIFSELRNKTQREAGEDIESIRLAKYIKAPKNKKTKTFAKDKIAVIYAMGNVIMGEGEEGNIGSDRISAAIREARKDSSIKAIVFRVNSGGGSALASEVIWREVKLAQEVKPVIASLGDVAASGGYYIVSPADKIIASPNTITGSIGVFGMLMNSKSLFNDKLGINIEVVKTNKHSDIGSMFRKLTAEERASIQYGVEDIYNTFITHVAEGRNMTKEAVDSIGQGRVWSGKNAINIGLVDEFGGLQKAIDIAAETAELENYRTVSLPKLKDPFQLIIDEFQDNIEASIIRKNLGKEYTYYKELQEIRTINGIQARMPYKIDIH